MSGREGRSEELRRSTGSVLGVPTGTEERKREWRVGYIVVLKNRSRFSLRSSTGKEWWNLSITRFIVIKYRPNDRGLSSGSKVRNPG